MKTSSKIHIALPVLHESENLPSFIKCMRSQDYGDFRLVVCVNNYEHWWDDPGKVGSCIDNQKSIDFLKTVSGLDLKIIDKSSKGNGWPEKKGGVGWARKVGMDYISEHADENDLIVCMDADTFYPDNYLSALNEKFAKTETILGLAIPYYHRLTGDESDRLILRYEIYMRTYLLNMLRIENPYAFTALGSAMAVTQRAYKKIGGMTPVKSGEDFYFLQKLIKTGKIGLWCNTVAYPSSRLSDRVLFGTGPALIKGQAGDWDSYPVYNHASFKRVGETFSLFPDLYRLDVPTPMDHFLKTQFRTGDLWGSFRVNYKDEANFVRACINKVDGLRILQYLRSEHKNSEKTDEINLFNWFEKFYGDVPEVFLKNLENLDFKSSSISLLTEIRDKLFEMEAVSRKQFDQKLDF